jgi:ABC-type sugar transport system ATPase subunit
MRVEIAGLHRRLGTTMVYVTHDQVEAMTLADRIAVMSVGYLQQFGSPMDVYHRPRNRFVAGFIGSPGMNFVEGRLETRDGALWFASPGLCVALEGGQLRAAQDAAGAGGLVALGVRPQSLIAAPDASVAAGRGEVRHVELMGSETFAHLDVAGQTFIMRLPGDQRTDVGDVLGFDVDAAHVHLFDAEGDSLTYTGDDR